MKIATIGKGNIGGGLGAKWRAAGHDVTELGQEGGDVSDADAVLLAVPSGAVEDALGKVQGLEGKTVLDATNVIGGGERPGGAASIAEYVKSRTNGPTAKTFNLNFARVYDQVPNESTPPGNIWSGDDEARETVEQLTRDAGYEPVRAGTLENARAQEDAIALVFGINQAGMGPFFYRMAPPES